MRISDHISVRHEVTNHQMHIYCCGKSSNLKKLGFIETNFFGLACMHFPFNIPIFNPRKWGIIFKRHCKIPGSQKCHCKTLIPLFDTPFTKLHFPAGKPRQRCGKTILPLGPRVIFIISPSFLSSLSSPFIACYAPPPLSFPAVTAPDSSHPRQVIHISCAFNVTYVVTNTTIERVNTNGSKPSS